MAFHDNDGIGSASEPQGAADVIEGVIVRRHLPQVMIENNSNLEFAGELLQSFNGAIVGSIGLVRTADDWSDFGQRVDCNKSPLRVCFTPFPDVIKPSLVNALPLGADVERFGGGYVLHDLIDALF